MSIIKSIALGMLQGIAEFLPISSSGHLQIMQYIFKIEETPLLFDIMLHLSTLLAVVLYFRKKIWKLLCILGRFITRKPRLETEDENDLLTGTDKRGRKTILFIILTTIVTGAIGVGVSKIIKTLPIKVVFIFFIVTGILLILSSIVEKKVEGYGGQGLTWYKALIIGIAQGIGTLPGISRSGSTIAGALFCHINKEEAAEYSFIVSIPAILGAFILELKDLQLVGSAISIECIIAGMAASFAWGMLSLSVLMKVIKKGRLAYFSFYLIPLGIIGLITFTYFIK